MASFVDRCEEAAASYYLNSSCYVHVYFRSQIRNLLQRAIEYYHSYSKTKKAYSEVTAQYLELKGKYESLLFQCKLPNEEKKKLEQELAEKDKEVQALGDQMKASKEKLDKRIIELESEMVKLAKSSEELEQKVKQRDELTRLLWTYTRETPFGFYGWLHSRGVAITWEDYQKFLAATTTTTLLSLLDSNGLNLPMLDLAPASEALFSDEFNRITIGVDQQPQNE